MALLALQIGIVRVTTVTIFGNVVGDTAATSASLIMTATVAIVTGVSDAGSTDDVF